MSLKLHMVIACLTHLHVMIYTMNRYQDILRDQIKQQTIVHTLLHGCAKVLAK